MFDFFKCLPYLSSALTSHSTSTMSEPEPFASLLLPELSANTDAFLTVYREGIARTESNNRIAAMQRFRIVHVHVNKTELVDLSEHELVSTNVRDSNNANYYNFFVERNASKPGPAVLAPVQSARAAATASLSSATSSWSTTAVIQQTASATTTTATTTPSSEAYPLIPLDEMPTPSSSVSQLPTQVPQPNKRTFGDRFTLSSTRAVHSSIQSPKCAAEDHVLGRGKFVKEDPMTGETQVIREIGHVIRQLEPEDDLYLFEFGILVDVVHNEAPNYELLKRQCFWLTTIICEVITLLYGDKLNPQAKRLKGAKPTPNEYLPNIAGRWKNLLIVAPENEVVRRVAIKFMERREEEYSKVGFH
jgi:hypothetical protein